MSALDTLIARNHDFAGHQFPGLLRRHPGIAESYRVTGMFDDVTTGVVPIDVPTQAVS